MHEPDILIGIASDVAETKAKVEAIHTFVVPHVAALETRMKSLEDSRMYSKGRQAGIMGLVGLASGGITALIGRLTHG